MRKGKMVLEQTVMWILIIIIAFVVGWGIFKLIKVAKERGLTAIFGG